MPRASKQSAARPTGTSKTQARNARQPTRNDESGGEDEYRSDVDVGGDEGERVGQDDDMLDMLNMLKELKKRKTAKPSSSAAFQAKRNALYASARKNADEAVQDGVAFIEQFRAKITEMKAQEVSQEQHLSVDALFKGQKDSAETLLDVFPSLLEDLSHRRAASIDETSAMLEAHSEQRQMSRNRLLHQARVKIEEDMDNQRVATDAAALIKHYKALLLA